MADQFSSVLSSFLETFRVNEGLLLHLLWHQYSYQEDNIASESNAEQNLTSSTVRDNGVCYLGDVSVKTEWRHNRNDVNWFFKFDFVKISLKKHNLAWLRNFWSQYRRLRDAEGRKTSFWKFVTKIIHFWHISAKIQSKNLKLLHY